MGWTNDLLEGLAEWLDDHGIGTWLPSGAYSTNATGIVFGELPQSPASVIALDHYSAQETPGEEYRIDGVQITCRAPGQDPRPVNDMADSIYEVLHGARHFDLGAIHIVQARRLNEVPIGNDESRRPRARSNYYLQTDRATAHLLD